MVATVAGEEREGLEAAVSELENRTGRNARKWHNSLYRRQAEYAEGLHSLGALRGHVFARVYAEGANYLDRTAYVVGDALAAYAEENGIAGLTGIAVIDGLKAEEGRRMGKVIRSRGVRLARIRGAKDEVSPLVRLADSVAGTLRASLEGDEAFRRAADRMRKDGSLNDI